MVVGERLFMPHLQMKVAPGVAGDQVQSGVGQRLPIHTVDYVDDDGLVVDIGKNLALAA
jgi:hypothetical protein